MFPSQTYTQRRNILANSIENGMILLLGNIENPINFEHNTYPFRQDSTFLYYIGIQAPRLAAIIDIDERKTILFGDEMTIDDIVWMGRLATLREKAELSDITEIQPFDKLYSHIQKSNRSIHYLPPYQSHNKILLQDLLGIPIQQLTPSTVLLRTVATQRNIKQDFELQEIEKAVNIAVDMHRMAIEITKPGFKEYEITNAIQYYAQNQDTIFAYPPIVTKRGEILHNHYQQNTLQIGDMVLNDSGVETRLGYCSDLTRTYPVDRRFTPLQEDMYHIVLNALKKGESLLQPGKKFIDIYYETCEELVDGLIQLGFMKGNPKEAVANNAHTLFFQCGLGHMMGLDVHDMEDLGEQYVGYTDDEPKNTTLFGLKSLRLGKALEPGNVLTVEPGIYIIPEFIDQCKANKMFTDFVNYDKLTQHQDFGGIRIEDNYVITPTGYRRIGNYLEREVQEIYTLRQKSL
jgi:Xaa-Pro aminopeptidase